MASQSRSFSLTKVLRVLLSAAFWALAFGTCMPMSVALANGSDNAVGLIAFVFPVTLLLNVLVHEVGHGLAAKSIGWRVHLIAVRPFSYRPAMNRFGLMSRLRSGDVGGLVVATPPLSDEWSRFWFLALGGPLANLVFSGLMFSLASFSSSSPHLQTIYGGLGLVSFAMGAFNLIPQWYAESRRSDGAILWDVVRGRGISKVRQNLSWLFGFYLDGIRPSEWDKSVISQIEHVDASDEDASLRTFLLLNRYYACAQYKKAQTLLEGSDVTLRVPDFAVELAFLDALMDSDVSRSREILSGVPDRLRANNFNYWRAQTLVHERCGEYADARISMERAELAAKKGKVELDEDDRSLFAAVRQGLPILPAFGHSQSESV